MLPSTASISVSAVVASSTLPSVRICATIAPDPSTPKWSFFQPRVPRPPCFTAAHSPWPTIESPVLSTMRWSGSLGRTRWNLIEVLTTPREGRVVGSFEIDIHQGQHRPQEALRLAKRQPEDEPQRQRGLDRVIRELALSASSTARRGCPCGNRVSGEPERDVASPDERALVLRPIADVVFCFVLRMDSRLHAEDRVRSGVGTPNYRQCVSEEQHSRTNAREQQGEPPAKEEIAVGADRVGLQPHGSTPFAVQPNRL